MRKGWKKGFGIMLILAMILTMMPMTALADLNTGHSVKVTFTVLYVDSSFNLGYNYGSSENTTFICQYSRPHSDTAYSNHTISIADIKAAADRLSVDEGYQIVGWTKAASSNPSINEFPAWIGNKTTACNKGDTIYLVAKNPNPQPVAPTAPGINDLPGILGSNPVKVDCTNDAAAHADALYALDLSSCTVGTVGGTSASGYTCTVTINGAVYAAQYNQTNGAHTLTNATANVQLSWNGNAWTAVSTLPVVFNVVCETVPTPTPTVTPTPTSGPDAPLDSALPDILGNAAVTVDCTSESANHDDGSYGYIAGGITVGDVTGDAQNGYTCTLTVDSSAYLAQYNEDRQAAHTLVEGEAASKSIALSWNGEQWVLASTSTLPVVFEVECQSVPAMGTVLVYAVTDGDKDNAVQIYSGKAAKGSNLIAYLEENVELESKTGYVLDKWFNWDWYGNKFGDDAVVNGWTNVYVTYTGDWQTVNVYAVTDGDKEHAELIYDGKALKGVSLIEYLEKNVTVAEKTGYALDKWYNWDYYGNKFGDDAVVNGWTNVYVTYLSQAYTIVYHGNGGVLASDAQKDQTTSGAKYGQEVTLKNNKTFVRTGYVLTGWAAQQDGEKVYDCSQKITDIPGVVDGKVHLYAVWQKHEDHKWVSTGTTATCTKAGEESFKCEICGETKTEPQAALGHEWDAWADDENGRTHTHACKREGCDATETKRHSWKETERVEPTRKLDGYVKYECEDCHAVYTKVLPALNNKPTYPDYSGGDDVIIIPDSTLRPVTTNTLTPVVTPVPVQPGDPIYTMVPNVPQTGDTTNNMPYVLTIGGAAAMLALVLALKKRAGGKA